MAAAGPIAFVAFVAGPIARRVTASPGACLVPAALVGAIIASGPPETVITTEIVHDVFGLDCVVIADPVSHTPLVVPVGVGHRADDRRTVAS